VLLQESLAADAAALDGERLAAVDGPALQGLLQRKAPLPLQEERARLLREVRRSFTKPWKTQSSICRGAPSSAQHGLRVAQQEHYIKEWNALPDSDAHRHSLCFRVVVCTSLS
jgi:hypothetical protein